MNKQATIQCSLQMRRSNNSSSPPSGDLVGKWVNWIWDWNKKIMKDAYINTPVTHLSMVYEGEMAKNQPVGLVLQLQDEVYHCCLDHLVPSHLSLPPHHLLYHQQSAPSLPNKRCCWWFTCKQKKKQRKSLSLCLTSRISEQLWLLPQSNAHFQQEKLILTWISKTTLLSAAAAGKLEPAINNEKTQ